MKIKYDSNYKNFRINLGNGGYRSIVSAKKRVSRANIVVIPVFHQVYDLASQCGGCASCWGGGNNCHWGKRASLRSPDDAT